MVRTLPRFETEAWGKWKLAYPISFRSAKYLWS